MKNRAVIVPSPEPRYHIMRNQSAPNETLDKRKRKQKENKLQLLARALSTLWGLLGQKV